MANRTFQTAQLGLVKRQTELLLIVSVGANGAVTLLKRYFTNGSVSASAAPTTGSGYAVGNGEGVRSVTRTGTGAWTITLSDPYIWPFGVELVTTASTTGVPSIGGIGWINASTSTQTNNGPGNGGTIAIQLVDFAGSAADPASGDILCLRVILGDASEP